jgi:23S rRNA pseudouridine2605 synthase
VYRVPGQRAVLLTQNQEIRKALAHVRLVVMQLIRVQHGPYQLADLPAGAGLEVRAKPQEKKQFKKRKRQGR